MKVADIYFIDFRTSFKVNMARKIKRLCEKAGIEGALVKDGNVAVKVHYGEPGNTSFVSPLYVRVIVDMIKGAGAHPFLADTNTLYKGGRTLTPQHLETAIRHGFTPEIVGAPPLIAGGIKGRRGDVVKIYGTHREEVSIAEEFIDADSLVVVSHGKGHIGTAFGGALKNLGMGCATRDGKLDMHSTSSPFVNRDRCNGCGLCMINCPADAIQLIKEKAEINEDSCIGCSECVAVCPMKAIEIRWNQDKGIMQEIMVEYAEGVMKGKDGKVFFVNFLNNITPTCDCHPNSDLPIVPDIGILASIDPVAIDKASIDLINGSSGIMGSTLEGAFQKGEDKFRSLYPDIDYNAQIDHAVRRGLGTREYRIIEVTV